VGQVQGGVVDKFHSPKGANSSAGSVIKFREGSVIKFREGSVIKFREGRVIKFREGSVIKLSVGECHTNYRWGRRIP